MNLKTRLVVNLTTIMHDLENHLTSRRGFLKTSSTAALAGSLAVPLIFTPKSRAASPGDTLKVGLIGCGGRGSGAAGQALSADSNVQLTAMGDAFADRLQGGLKNLRDAHGDKVKVTVDNSFVGWDAYQKVLASGVDVVILAPPPGFRPLHLKAAIDAGKHVFCEKPMAVDGPGVRSVLQSAAEAKRKNLSLVSGFCWRYNPVERELMKRIHDGDMGEPMTLYNTYNTGYLWSRPRQPNWTDMEWQMRNWYYFTWLSGDHIVEQAVHSLDKMSWAMKDVPPVQCVAHGGRQVRTDPVYGHIFDHFSVVYEYANGARGFHFSRQQANCASDNSDYLIGTKGVAKIKAFGPVSISGDKAWRKGSREGVPDMYQVEHNELFASIRNGTPLNNGEWMAQSTLLAIMGRMAAYTGQVITWEQALNSTEELLPKNLAWDAPIDVPSIAMPGKTKFV